ncbi:hypothetical protein [Mycolicibacterium psychrotolerans]|uniref:Uncharacterized protein n=1 Tax=Mycolicibacterium psychrotolerans TaxID=216929 RepID=A0A7I7M4U0_9MYCO|nr:hypothetical protein [Mycolicibacterium psychrotolerans]BBX67208.1 hypothetical protein MPSYJ_06690 [Mycolicibacterium psychrotolerans]
MSDPPDAVLVTGAARAGVTSVLERLRERMPGRRFVEADALAAGEAPLVVVFVVSADAPMVRSDGALAAGVTARTGAVIGVVNKVDDHRAWRGVLADDRDRLTAAVPRLAGIPWVGAAAHPRLGEPLVNDLVAVLTRELADPDLTRRTAARARQADLDAGLAERDAERAEVVRAHRSTRTGDARWRREAQRVRLELTYSARQRCAALRADLFAEVAAVTRPTRPAVEARVRQRCADTLAEVDDQIDARLAELATAPVPAPADREVTVPAPPRHARRLETQLMVVLGAGFGFGVALVVARLVARLAGPVAVGGTVAGGLAGLAVTVWVVRARALLHDRAVLERWVVDAVAALRIEVEDRVSARLLAVETVHAVAVDQRLAHIEAELRRYASRRRSFDPSATDSVVTDR